MEEKEWKKRRRGEENKNRNEWIKLGRKKKKRNQDSNERKEVSKKEI